jgi:hypothetical protein
MFGAHDFHERCVWCMCFWRLEKPLGASGCTHNSRALVRKISPTIRLDIPMSHKGRRFVSCIGGLPRAQPRAYPSTCMARFTRNLASLTTPNARPMADDRLPRGEDRLRGDNLLNDALYCFSMSIELTGCNTWPGLRAEPEPEKAASIDGRLCLIAVCA